MFVINIKNDFLIRDNLNINENIKNNSDLKETSFNNILQNEIEKNSIKFSKHANQRLNIRKINLSAEQMTRVEDGINFAKDKGINEALLLVDNICMVVNTKNNVVVTIMNKEKNNIFTNIDGAVIV